LSSKIFAKKVSKATIFSSREKAADVNSPLFARESARFIERSLHKPTPLATDNDVQKGERARQLRAGDRRSLCVFFNWLKLLL
jgi:hypothetical protein